MNAPLTEMLSGSRRIVVFTGAGISTESGIPDFRSPGGSWSQAQPVYYDDFVQSQTARDEYWRQKSIAHRDFAGAAPNVGHRILADWEARGIIRGIITQNIDGLHQIAGNRQVLELHGTAREVSCLGCRRRWPAEVGLDWFQAQGRAPDCPECGSPLKHATISFGQSLDADVLRSASEWTGDCDLFLALGSSLVVHPAAGLPLMAQAHGAKMVIINRDPTPLDRNADLVLRSPLGETLSQADAGLPRDD